MKQLEKLLNTLVFAIVIATMAQSVGNLAQARPLSPASPATSEHSA